ncbi:MAG: type III pantothenate kinase [Nitrospirae bacterium]|nr:MAG: type III pantothenate kinase [Nitrospirota bacterium]
MSLLCLDIGNSRTKAGIFEGDDLREVRSFSSREIVDKVGQLLNGSIEAAVVSSVVPSVIEVMMKEFKKHGVPEVILVRHTTTGRLKLKIKNPETLGPDRLSEAVGAYEMAGTTSVVIDAGTATTTTIVDADGNLIGGTIMPGIEMMLRCLHEKTAALPQVEPFSWERPFGIDTKSSIMAGVLYSTLGLLEKVIEEVHRMYGQPVVFLTGGRAEVLRPYMRDAVYEPYLTLLGMKAIYERRHR